tara:strand:+ start:453 stop:641 length:189 start_codon:yes stop_codon:yes gene_type:complete
MGNMSYCRFENTMSDLQDCLINIGRKAENDFDESSRQELIALFKEVAEDYDGDVVEFTNSQY